MTETELQIAVCKEMEKEKLKCNELHNKYTETAVQFSQQIESLTSSNAALTKERDNFKEVVKALRADNSTIEDYKKRSVEQAAEWQAVKTKLSTAFDIIEKLKEFAESLKQAKDEYVHEFFAYDNATGLWEGSAVQEAYLIDQEELIEKLSALLQPDERKS